MKDLVNPQLGLILQVIQVVFYVLRLEYETISRHRSADRVPFLDQCFSMASLRIGNAIP